MHVSRGSYCGIDDAAQDNGFPAVIVALWLPHTRK